MKKKTEPSLTELKREIEELKLKKQKKLQIATSTTERNKLLGEIQELEVKKNSFGRTFKRGLKTTGKTLWKGISTASRNLNKNAPEMKEFAKTMTDKPRQPQSVPDFDKIFLPRQVQKPTQRSKKKKRKKANKKARKMVYQQPTKQTPSWGLA